MSWDEEMRARFLRPEIGDGLRKANRYHHSIEISPNAPHTTRQFCSFSFALVISMRFWP